MSNFFNDVVNDLDKLEKDVLGPDYEYWKWIKSPSELGMSSDGNLGAMGNDIIGLVKYMETLIAGGGAQRSNQSGQGGDDPLGDRYFLKTGAKCHDAITGEKTARYLFIDNIPNGDIPFISSALGTNFGAFEGIIPGIMQSTTNINPLQIFQAFMEGVDPSCAAVTLETRDNNNNILKETRHLTFTDIKNVEPCLWAGSTNPISGASRSGCGALSPKNGTCQGCVKEGFQNLNPTNLDEMNLLMNNCDKNIKNILKLAVLIVVIITLIKVFYKK